MRAELRVRAGDRASMLAEALGPETDAELSRAEASVLVDGGELVVRVRADDLVALRAVLNSYMRWLKLAIDSVGALEPRE